MSMRRLGFLGAIVSLTSAICFIVGQGVTATAVTSSMPRVFATGSSYLGLTAPVVEAAQDTSNDCIDQSDLPEDSRPICSNYNAWLGLNYADKIGSGTRIVRQSPARDGGSVSCSVGWIAKVNIAGKEYDPAIITAGHCGALGEQWYYYKAKEGDTTGQRYDLLPVGKTVENFSCTWNPNSDSCLSSDSSLDYDLSIIEVTSEQAIKDLRPALTMEQLNNIIDPIKAKHGWDFTGYDLSSTQWGKELKYEELYDQEILVCRLGWKSGLSCGVPSNAIATSIASRQFIMPFRTTASTGDSGGTVFAITKTGLHPVGIHTSSWHSTNSTDLYATAALILEPVLSGTGIELYSE